MNLKRLRYFILLFVAVMLSASAAVAKSLEEDLIYRASFGRVQDVEILLSQGANPNAVDPSGATALAVTSDRREAESVAIAIVLLRAGADPNLPDEKQNYPIFNAIRQKNSELVKLLMENGANYNVQDSNKKTPLALATELGDEASKAYIQQAIERDRAALAMLRSKENLQKLTTAAAFESCAEAYFAVVLADRPYATAEEQAALQATIADHKTKAQTAARDIKRIFGLKDKEIVEVMTASQAAIKDEVGWLGEKRKRAPFGTETDMKERCTPIAAKWQIKWDPQRKK